MILDDDKNKILIKKSPVAVQSWTKVTATGLAHSLEGSSAYKQDESSIPGAGPILRILKVLRNEGTAFAREIAWLGWTRNIAVLKLVPLISTLNIFMILWVITYIFH